MKKLDCALLGEMCEFLLDGEPVFVIRAQDFVAPGTIEDYINRSKAAGGKNISRATERLLVTRAWQEANPDKVKVAD